jgi:hypothetical protein
MSGPLLQASWRVVGRPPVLICMGVAVLLTIAVPLVDSGHADQVRLGVATLLACALAATADDPASEVTAATPHPHWVRCGSRLLLGLAMALPIAILTLALTELQDAATPTPVAGVQMLAVLLTGPAVGFGVWAWGNVSQPTYAALVGVLCLSLALWLVPATWSVIQVQPWGPPLEAVLIRCAALALLACVVVVTAWCDPASRLQARSGQGNGASEPISVGGGLDRDDGGTADGWPS